ncbi:hypothetical protein BDV32DRAFT_157875 [Aspergillus pseudonomiae]|uniref:FAD-binding domain-containing protein n=1 Tax=Aspergillus pseudonomiae TaxID=1506151 RepID=A0A5N7CZC3_9EURO|nr:uncharacterized protein BDV37DRAFT_297719 [Aspergillus pseudonomiae]KAB8261891.1 hypothetical protein BDV32DRAFT_157875 [Aspergillus pseudonomiae]KAE8399514.1 hypothetical protein BDV37DRAFT_297719 [Aspergillus pseudonomiae]
MDSTTKPFPLLPEGSRIHIIEIGFAGLGTAIECRRRGLSVTVYERFPELKPLGDIISFGSNGGRIFARWGSVVDRMLPVSIKLQDYGFRIHKYTGEHVHTQDSLPLDRQAPTINGHRGELHQILFNYARNDLNIPINLGCEVTGYFESASGAGIQLASGDKVYGDVVIGSDGVRSQARSLVLGRETRVQSSGYAIYRAWFSNEDILADPLTRHLSENGDTFNGWIGPDVHLLVSTLKGGKDVCWVLTHKDASDISDRWSFPGKLTDVYKVLEGWDPVCHRIISKTPESALIDWKLIWQDPLPTWVSKDGHIALAGDSAHAFLPTSAQGATQALEDGVTIAICLSRAGKYRIPDALHAFEKIRYDRVRKVQETGKTTRDKWHNASWDNVKRDPKAIELPREDWILNHDAEQHANNMCDQIFGAIRGESRL